ncbi:tripartite tricarboxylate transporter substrate binding protein [Cupriavidus sp. BIC8F]|uniref:Bug family tripartite tricarboxylate transporter substrate binding protein n=1 Tax=Cupriavidus sp. BIC8F TaxID=3079014 RepID=UPI00291621F9|nr:tripartite tricarboxylate transporter substrate binding protein [Cupriavidus sp. BIC8F]
MKRRNFIKAISCMGAGSMAPILAHAAANASYPASPVRLVAPFPPGGTVDILARVVGAQLTKETSQAFIVDNRAGAGGTIGADAVARAKPDGYTILFGAAHHAIAQTVYPSLPYDIRSMTAISFLGRVDHVLLVTNKLPVKTVGELVAYLKANPDKLAYGSPGTGTLHHLMAEQFKAVTGTRMMHVPYKGSSPALVDLISGTIQVYFETMPSALQYVRNGSVRALAVTSKQRSRSLPDLPTIAESGVSNYDAASWYGLFAPSGTPASVVSALNAATTRAFANSSFVEQWRNQGAEPGGGNPDVLRKLLLSEVDRWSVVAREAKIRID